MTLSSGPGCWEGWRCCFLGWVRRREATLESALKLLNEGVGQPASQNCVPAVQRERSGLEGERWLVSSPEMASEARRPVRTVLGTHRLCLAPGARGGGGAEERWRGVGSQERC